jgi:thiol-disulfide isomerase/thioredoxin
MNKKIIVIAIAALLVVSGAFVVFSGQNSDSNDTADSTTSANESSMADEQNSIDSSESAELNEIEQVSSDGLGYVEYSDQLLADSSGSKRVLFFHAPWCSVCNFYEGQIEEQGVPSDVTILKIDYDSQDELKEKYSVTTQSTFVLLDESGEIVKSWPFARGLSDIQDLYSQI